MATTEECRAFIEAIAPLVQKHIAEYDRACSSAIIAQACLESGYGGHGSKRTKTKANHHNYFGLKYRSDNRVTVKHHVFTDVSQEQNTDGTYRNITDSWYGFDTMEDGIIGYLQWTNIARYAACKNQTDPMTYLNALRAAGYATSLKYVTNCMAIVKKWNLTQYDKQTSTKTNIAVTKTGTETTKGTTKETKKGDDGMDIIKCTSTANTTACNRMPKYIVVHYTAGKSSKAGSAKATAQYFAKASTKASADYIVDDADIIQYNPDATSRYCWAVGGSKYKSATTSEGGKMYGKITNANSISVEMCSNKVNTKTMNATDTDWYFTQETIANTIEIVQYLMKKYDIPADNVYMHHHVTGKICPNPWCIKEASLAAWKTFKALIGSTPAQTTQTTTTTTKISSSAAKTYKVQCGAFTNKSNAEKLQAKIKAKGTDTLIIKSGIYYKVQCGAFTNKSNAETLKQKLKGYGFDAVVVTT